MKKLILTKETLRALQPQDAAEVRGGTIVTIVISYWCGSNHGCMTLNGCNGTRIMCVPTDKQSCICVPEQPNAD